MPAQVVALKRVAGLSDQVILGYLHLVTTGLHRNKLTEAVDEWAFGRVVRCLRWLNACWRDGTNRPAEPG